MDQKLTKLIQAKNALEQRAAEMRARCKTLAGQREAALAELEKLGVKADGEDLLRLALTELAKVKVELDQGEARATEIEKALEQIGRE